MHTIHMPSHYSEQYTKEILYYIHAIPHADRWGNSPEPAEPKMELVAKYQNNHLLCTLPSLWIPGKDYNLHIPGSVFWNGFEAEILDFLRVRLCFCDNYKLKLCK